VQFEAIVPAHSPLAYLGVSLEHLIAAYPLVVANRDAGAVNEADARALPEAEQLEEQGHLDGHTRLYLHKAIVGHRIGEILPEVHLYIAEVVMLEVAVGVEME
jgi:hypothetical protein